MNKVNISFIKLLKSQWSWDSESMVVVGYLLLSLIITTHFCYSNLIFEMTTDKYIIFSAFEHYEIFFIMFLSLYSWFLFVYNVIKLLFMSFSCYKITKKAKEGNRWYIERYKELITWRIQ